MNKILLVRPNNFDVTSSINPWMNINVEVNTQKAFLQWEELKHTLEKLNCEVTVIDSKEGLNDMVFAANAGMIFNDIAIPSKFKDSQRIPEEEIFTEWYKRNTPKTASLSPNSIWEGQACTVIWDKNAIFSLSSRANRAAYEEIINIWSLQDYEYRFVELIDPFFYHLDVCFCKLNDDSAFLCPLAFSSKDYEWIRSKFRNIIEVNYDDALNFTCNCCVVGNNVIINANISSELREKLEQLGFKCNLLDMSEFIKSGGSAKCLIFQYS